MEEKIIAQIGRLKSETFDQPYQQFVENMYHNQDNKMIVCFFDVTEDSKKDNDDTLDMFAENSEYKYKVDYKKIEIEEVGANSKKHLQYCYRKGRANRGDFTFTTKPGDSEKKIKAIRNVCNNFIEAGRNDKNLNKETAFFEALKKFLDDDDKRNLLINEINDVLNGFDKKSKKYWFDFCFKF